MKQLVAIILICSCLFITGCVQTEEKSNELDLMLFTNLSFQSHEEISSFVDKKINNDEIETEVHQFLPLPEKLMVEMVAGEGDLYIVNDSLYEIVFDPVILQPLDELVDDFQNKPELAQFVSTDQHSGRTHLYGIPIGQHSSFLKGLGHNDNAPLIAVMIKDRAANLAGLELIGQMYKEE